MGLSGIRGQRSEVRGQVSEKPFHRKERKEKICVIASEAKQSRKCVQQKNAGLLRFARNDGFLYSHKDVISKRSPDKRSAIRESKTRLIAKNA